VADRPYTMLCCAMSIDGYIDDLSDRQVRLADEDDLDRVDAVRASCDAILVGANTLWQGDPDLVIQSAQRRQERVQRGKAENPMKIAVTASGEIDPWLRFFTEGEADKVVYCTTPAVERARKLLGEVADVADSGDPISLRRMLADIGSRGVDRLLVEGGGAIQTQFLSEGLADELQLLIAPAFIADTSAPRFVEDGSFPSRRWGERIRLVEVRKLGDLVLLRYALSYRFNSGAE
jgi:5-amino-6-(5-phosphoribosylamino)uracil reductase